MNTGDSPGSGMSSRVVGGYVGHGGENKNAYGQSWLPAPKLPNGAIKPRKNPAPTTREDIPEPGESPVFKMLRRR